MKTIEEKIWEYLDGSATQTERAELEKLMEKDPAIQIVFTEISSVSALLNATELDEPSMSFTRNVMEKVELEIKPVALKTKVDNRIMYLVGGFFILSILAVLGTAIFSATGSTTDYDLPQVNFNFDISRYITPTTRNIFLLADAVIALVYFDGVLRRKMDKGRG